MSTPNASTPQTNELASPNPQAAKFPSSAVGWGAVAILTTFYILSYADRKLLSLMVVPIQHDLGINDFQFGILQGFAFSLLYVVAGIPIGYLVDHKPRRLIIYIGVTFWSVATALSGLAQNFTALMLARFGVGVGEATLSPAGYSMMSDLFSKQKLSTALGVYGAGVSLGGGLSYAVGGSVISLVSASHSAVFSHLHAWQWAFIITGLPGVLLAFIIFLVREPARTGRIGVASAAPRAPRILSFMLDRWRLIVGHFLGFSMIGMWSYSVSSWAPAYFIRSFQWPAWKVGFGLAAAQGICGTIGTIVGGRLTDAAFGRGILDAHLRIPLWSVLMALPFGVAAFLVREGGLAMLFLSLMELFLMVFTGSAVSALQLVTPNELRGRISAIYLFVVTLIGYGAGPVITGAITQFGFGDPGKVGWSLVILMSISAPLSAALLGFGLAPMRRALTAAEKWS